MSRARPIGGLWFDTKLNSQKATPEQLELLAATEGVPLDDLLDEGLTQGQVVERLRDELGSVVPPEVLERKRQRKLEAQKLPKCRICGPAGRTCEGGITRHHFIPRWLMRELPDYNAYAARSRCTIPICVGRHRDLHMRSDEAPKSIVEYLTNDERALAQKMLDALHEHRPVLFDLIMRGDESSYEYVLVRDYMLGEFHKPAKPLVIEHHTPIATTGA